MDSSDLADRLIESEQRLADLPELEDQLRRALADNARLRPELEATQLALQGITRSLSWRLTAPLRKLRALSRRR